ncbi:MAG: hypothetical protein J5967_03910 [Oscillospiraceae bacterium]|nr:hypothetical protein [Oscillospiraceae bacterium]
MADYKELINGTLGTLTKLGGKVKDAAVSTGVTGVYAKGANRARAFGQITKLTLALNGEHEELKRVYAEIGRLYYEQAKAAPEGFFVPLFEQAGRLTDSIRQKQAEIDGLKADYLEPGENDVEVEIGDFDDIVSAAEREAMGSEDET